MMTPKEYAELLEYINENHGWDKMWDNLIENNRRCVKYVESSSDTRDGKIWIVTVTLRDTLNPLSVGNKDKDFKPIDFRENECTVENIKNWLNEFVNGGKPNHDES